MKSTFVRLTPSPDMEPSDFTPVAAFTSDDHSEINHTYFATDDGSILTGVWESAPCKEEIESYPVHEMMSVISGSLTLTDENGNTETFTTGDVLFIPKGAKCTWHITETFRKFYMISS